MKNMLSCLRKFSKRLMPFGALATLSLFYLIPSTALAVSPSQKCGTNDVSCVIAFGDQLISNRQTALDTLNNKVVAFQQQQQISDNQATSIENDITTNKNGLSTLKTTLDAEKNAKAARQDIKDMYVQFRIFAVVLPRDARRLHLAVEMQLRDKLEDLKPQIANSIDQAPSSEQTDLNKLFSDYKNQLSLAEAQINIAQATWPALTPDNYNNTATNYRADLRALTTAEQATHKDLHNAGDDLHKIAQTLKNTGSGATATAAPN
jgi:hypothetical protein